MKPKLMAGEEVKLITNCGTLLFGSRGPDGVAYLTDKRVLFYDRSTHRTSQQPFYPSTEISLGNTYGFNKSLRVDDMELGRVSN